MMKYCIALLLLPLFTYCGDNQSKPADKLQDSTAEPKNEQVATYYLIRHAEKERTDPKDQDPSLNIDGMKRAKHWAEYFEPIAIDKIYITKYIRTKQTISFIAQQKQITPQKYKPHQLYSETFLRETNHETTLVVGHSNTIPQLANKLLGEERFGDMDDNDNATLFKIMINGDDKKVETIKVEEGE